jgi:hypothetical protein
MNHAHHHAVRHGITRLILDVLPARTAVISFYRRLGYAETEPSATESPIPMIYMQRPDTERTFFPSTGLDNSSLPDPVGQYRRPVGW